MDRKFLDAYYKMEREHWWFQVREKIILDQIKSTIFKNESLDILNIGAATGRSSEILQSFGEVQSLEYDEPSYVFCRDVLKMSIDKGSITELPYTNESFDCVCAFDVVEHVEDHEKAVSELFRVCKPGGKIFITVPAFMSLWSNHDVVNHHVRRYQKKQLLDLFKPFGGRLIRSSYFNFFLFCPIYIFRLAQRMFAKKRMEEIKPDNDMIESSFINAVFKTIFSFERALLKKINFPFGVSILLVWQKK